MEIPEFGMSELQNTFCKMIHLPHFGGEDPKNGAYDSEFGTLPRFLYNAPYPPSFISLCSIIQKLSCSRTNKNFEEYLHSLYYAMLVEKECSIHSQQLLKFLHHTYHLQWQTNTIQSDEVKCCVNAVLCSSKNKEKKHDIQPFVMQMLNIHQF